MKIRCFLLFVSIHLAAITCYAGTKLDFTTVDQLTYRCFEEKKWDSVIVVGKQALRQDIDYYYLRVRMGISYYEKQEYIHAVVHLTKARRFNSGDPMVTDYLYRAYVFANRNEEADLLRSALPGNQTTNTGNSFLEKVHFESGYTFSSDNSPKNSRNIMGKDSIYGERDLYGYNLYENLALRIKLSKRVRIDLAYNYLNFSKTKYVQYGRPEAHRDSIIDNQFSRDYFYSFPWMMHNMDFQYQVKQHEVHLGASIELPDGFTILPAVHFIHVSYTLLKTGYRTDSISDTAFFLKVDNSYHLFTYPSLVYSFSQKDTSFNNWVAALTITKDLGIFNLGLSGSWSNLNHSTQYQAGLTLTYYPLGNLNFYGTSSVTGFFQGKDTRLLLSQAIGGRVFPWMWIEGNLCYGDYTNANIFNGSVVYNSTGVIDYRAGANLDFVVSRHIVLSLIYQYFQKESQQLFYVRTPNPLPQVHTEMPVTKNNPYNTNTIIGGITWKL